MIETGLGGRLDATNVLKPILTITTGISLDHTEILGSTIKQIAQEKAGIIKPAVPHLMAIMPREAEKVMRETCRIEQAPIHRVRRSRMRIDRRRMRMDYRTGSLSVENLEPSVHGLHQLQNSATVIEAVSLANRYGSLGITKEAVVTGLKKAEWPGRFQILKKPDHPIVILDVAHNETSMAAFVDTFKRKFPSRSCAVLSGFVKGKAHLEMIEMLLEIGNQFAFVPLSSKRSFNIGQLESRIRWQGTEHQKFGSISAAYNRLLKLSNSDDIITVVGSHYLVGEFLQKYGEQWKVRGNR